MKSTSIQIRGASQNNLKNLDLDIPLNRMTVITGVSGSGKSSLAFDTLYAEGQRRYVETFSPYARQFMDRMDRPKVDQILGVPPAIAIDRKDPVRTSRSTVGTMTELTDYVKLLFARQAVLHCRRCSRPVQAESPEHIWQALPQDKKALITFPFGNQPPTGSKAIASPDLIQELLRLGYDRILQNNQMLELAALSSSDLPPVLDVVADRLVLSADQHKRTIDSLETALRLSGGKVDVWIDNGDRHSFSNRLHCAHCNIEYNPPLPNLFSFNSPIGACETCRGFGRVIDMDLDLIIPDRTLSLAQGAVKPWGGAAEARFEYRDLSEMCKKRRIPLHKPFQELTLEQQQAVIQGTEKYYGIRGYFNWLEGRTYKMHVRVFLSRYRSYDLCQACNGTRFKPETLLYRLQDKGIAELYAMDVDRAAVFFKSLDGLGWDEATSLILNEILSRLRFLQDVGLGYLTLDRQSRTLSGGEVQRVALAAALGSSLVNTLYVLDEPSIGLHPRDNERLIRILGRLRRLPNTIVVVEHDPAIIKSGDLLLDLGPEAGEQGGQIMYFGPLHEAAGTLTADYLSGRRHIPTPAQPRRLDPERRLTIQQACENNLKRIDVQIPLGRLVCLSGVSGSGKSTLAEEILYKGLLQRQGRAEGKPGRFGGFLGAEQIKDVVLVDQRPIGRTPRANVLTYTKAMDTIRTLWAGTPEARKQGFKPGYFSFNVAGGRCETCKGEGYETVEMQFLSDVLISCPDCNGQRFKPEILDIAYKGLNIRQLLDLTVSQALAFFSDHPKIIKALEPLARVGLDYLRLGQPLSTFSGGEAQRLKLSRFLGENSGGCLLIFDEPTTGLHFKDIAVLLKCLHALVDQDNTVLVIEHNLDVIKNADWVIDLGPEGGDQGGTIVAQGTPQTLAAHPASHTGRYLRAYLEQPPSQVPTQPVATHTNAANNGHAIQVRGARQHNLKDVAVALPHKELIVLTGVSGSGKSTLAFDILFAEGQRRYLESLAPFVRQYMKILERPEVDLVTGLSPTVAIEQRISHSSRRSTVATLTEVYHFLRLLYSKLGTPACPGCGRPLEKRDPGDLLDLVRRRYRRRKALILAPKVSGRKGYHKDVLARARKLGFVQARIDGRIQKIAEDMALSRYHDHSIDLVVGTTEGAQRTIAAVLEKAFKEGDGHIVLLNPRDGGEEIFSTHGRCPSCGISAARSDPRLFSFNATLGACPQCAGLGVLDTHEKDSSPPETCPACLGSRLKPAALAIKIQDHTIWDLVRQPAQDLYTRLDKFTFQPPQRPLADPIMAELKTRLALMNRLGLGYLSLARSGDTLSGGEAQRVRLAAQLGSNLTGVTYILDEPTIGLHARDNHVLVQALTELRDRGNSIIVVEHDEETIRAADTIIDLGPGAGREGGKIVAHGRLEDLRRSSHSVTGAFLDGGSRRITSRLRPCRRQPALKIVGAQANNLKNIDVRIPLARLVCITGVSGSGKSSLIKTTLLQGLKTRLKGAPAAGNHCRTMENWQAVKQVLEVDHSPIGRTPRSVPASYVGFLTDIRNLLAQTPEARARGYNAARFSFNVAQGQCPACKGQGRPKVEMSFLPDVYVPCEVCRGSRYTPETLAVRYKDKSMADILQMTFAEAALFFSAIPRIRRAVQFVCDVGLGYLQLGQSSPTLSGGEAQRIKIAKEMTRPTQGHTIYILDEPSTGLHLADVQRLLDVLQNLVEQGNTVVTIEHNMELIKAADHIIDLGPEGGAGGGKVVAVGSPVEMLRKTEKSHTARFLSKYLVHQ